MFTDAEKKEIQFLRSQSFEAYKELITIYKTPTQTILSTSNDFNFGFDVPATDVDFLPESGRFYAKIQHSAFLPDQKIREAANNNPIAISTPYVKINVTGEAVDFIKDAEKIVLDGIEFKPITKNRPRGFFERIYQEFYFERID